MAERGRRQLLALAGAAACWAARPSGARAASPARVCAQAAPPADGLHDRELSDVQTLGSELVDVRRFGARGDGRSDDSAALQRALDALQPGQVLHFGNRRYVHASRLVIRRPGVTLWGYGTTLHAGNPADQALLVQASGVRVLGFTLTAVTDERRHAPWESRIAIWRDGRGLAPVSDVQVRDNRIIEAGPPDTPLANSSSSAAIFVHNASGFVVAGNLVRRSLSDAIHITGGSRNGQVVANTVRESGDDMVAVVSYLSAGEPGAEPPQRIARELASRRRSELVRNVLIADNDLAGQYWGRGISVVGGEDVSILGNRIDACTHGAGIYIAREQGWSTFGVRNVRVVGNHISRVQTTRPEYTVLGPTQRWRRAGHGAVELVAHVFDDEAAEPELHDALRIHDVLLQGNLIEDCATAGIRIGYGWGQPQRMAWRAGSLAGVLRRHSGAPIHQVQLLGNRLQRVAQGGIQVLNADDATAGLLHAGNSLDGRPLQPEAGRVRQADDGPPARGASLGCPVAAGPQHR